MSQNLRRKLPAIVLQTLTGLREDAVLRYDYEKDMASRRGRKWLEGLLCDREGKLKLIDLENVNKKILITI